MCVQRTEHVIPHSLLAALTALTCRDMVGFVFLVHPTALTITGYLWPAVLLDLVQGPRSLPTLPNWQVRQPIHSSLSFAVGGGGGKSPHPCALLFLKGKGGGGAAPPPT